jgi:lysophospholipase L1-like esterase
MSRGLVLLLAASLALNACGGGSHSSTTASTSADPATSAPEVVGSSTTAATSAATTATTPATAATTAATAPKARGPIVVGLGNSVPAGAACSCQNFVSAYAAMVAAATNTQATVDNDAVSGSTSADVVNLMSRASVQAQLKSATTVLIMTGANDYNDAFDQVSLGAPASDTYGPVATAVQDNVTAVVQKIHSLNGGAHVVVLDYWAAMEDGAVAAKDYDPPAMAASVACTTSVNEALSVAAKATGALYLSTLTALKGPNGTNDPTALLAADGDHPDAAGHQLIAKTIYAALPTG